MAHSARKRSTTRRLLLCGALISSASTQTTAGRLDYQLEAEALHSDNIARTEFDPRTETALVPRVRFDFTSEGADLTLRARGRAEYWHYLDNSFPDEARGELAAQLSWAVLPGRLAFVLEDYLSEQPVDFRSAEIPGNVQSVNVLVAGATLKGRLAPGTDAQLDLRVADTYAEQTETFDATRYGATLSVKRDLSPTSQGSINVSSTQVDFDQSQPNIDYSRSDAYLRYEKQISRGSFDLDVGQSWIDPEGARSASTTLLRGAVTWRASARSEFRLRARRQYADAVQDLVLRQSDFEDALIADLADPRILVTPSAYLQKYADVQYRYRGDRVTFRLRPQYQKNHYLDDPTDDREIHGLSARVDYRSRPRLTLFAQGTKRNQDYLTGMREDRDSTLAVGFEHRLTRHWKWGAQAARSERNSSIPGGSHTENQVRATISWTR